MKKLRYMNRYSKISDEELATYLDGMLSDGESAKVDAAMDVDMFEVLNVSRKAMDEFHAGKVIPFPSWDTVDSPSVQPDYEPLAMAGFLGDDNAGDPYDDGTDGDE